MNAIWGGMLLTGIVYGILTGRADAVAEAVLSSAKEGVSLCVTMFGVMALWSGLMEIAKEAGLIRAVTGRLRPVMRFLFPRIPKDHPALEHIAANCAANVLGLGSASTVYGLKAMEALEELEEERRRDERSKKEQVSEEDIGHKAVPVKESEGSNGINETGQRQKRKRIPCKVVPRGTASSEMCTFLILNISSLQLIPVNIIAYRTQYGSVNPTAVVGPGIVATAVSTGVAVVFCKAMESRA
ncbi:MAG: nucleoside recognition protein [Lachnospiraceae bacterium]|nr:nucleoside recognition protein [Lachnospiraceae bacterium]